MTIAITPEQLALRDAVRTWAERSKAREVARGFATASLDGTLAADLPAGWAGLVELGLPGIHVPEEYGGAGMRVEDLAVAVEELGYQLAAEPLWPTALASLCLLQVADSAVAKALLPELAEGRLVAAVGLGENEPVIGAGPAQLLVLPIAGQYVAVKASDVDVTPVKGLDPTRAIGRVTGGNADADALDGLTPQRVHDLALTLAAAEAAGIAGWAVDAAVAYAKVREQFGRTIGSFQSIKHMCADMLARAELARAAAWDAARAINDGVEHELAVAVAASTALNAAVDNAKDCIQIHGGIGFTWEHDAHLYLRRALTLRQLMGPVRDARQRAVELARGGVRRHLTLDLVDVAAEERAAVRAALESVTGLEPDAQRKQLAATGFLVPHWPKPWGRDANAEEQLVIAEEFANAGVKQPDLVIGSWAVPTIIAHGSDDQRERFVLPSLRGEITWCQMFSEPGAGSDLASLRTKATRTDGGWLLNGQKVWTSMATRAHWAICLARTNPEAEEHQGITYFLVDMKTPGLDIRPLRELTGNALFNEIFITDLFVPDENVVGEVDQGWPLARTTLANERVGMSSGSSMGNSVEDLLALSEKLGLTDDALVNDKLGGFLCQGQAQALLGVRATLRQLSGTDPGAMSSVRKLVGMHHTQDIREYALELAGADGAVQEGISDRLALAFLMTRQLTIAGGTSQVLRNVIGERILGLPRDDIRRNRDR
ncbi:MAG: 3-oxochol-4-en-24-oyl-CoA dehydrogenase [Frankiales bacterium]|jgi:alkylation response protein AidB-like acyl-CoA dehydrogenase|nr:3-oxochol-4-en-24-oyl-CoA dehydrogenase [Frankiales bacterium]